MFHEYNLPGNGDLMIGKTSGHIHFALINPFCMNFFGYEVRLPSPSFGDKADLYHLLFSSCKVLIHFTVYDDQIVMLRVITILWSSFTFINEHGIAVTYCVERSLLISCKALLFNTIFFPCLSRGSHNCFSGCSIPMCQSLFLHISLILW